MLGRAEAARARCHPNKQSANTQGWDHLSPNQCQGPSQGTGKMLLGEATLQNPKRAQLLLPRWENLSSWLQPKGAGIHWDKPARASANQEGFTPKCSCRKGPARVSSGSWRILPWGGIRSPGCGSRACPSGAGALAGHCQPWQGRGHPQS